MARLYVYRRKTDDRLEAIAGVCEARPEEEYDRFAVSRSELAELDPNDIYHVAGGGLALKPVALLTVDKPVIAADGLDQAVVSVAVTGLDPLPGIIDIAVNGYSETVTLANGAGQLPAITAQTPGEITVRAVDTATYFDQNGITISAED